jgi:hypothetical protein
MSEEKKDFTILDSGKREQFDSGMVRDVADNKGNPSLLPFNALNRLALHLEKGSKKYGRSNWRLSAPVSRFFDSAMRHLFKYAEDIDPEEDHLSAALFNIAAIVEMQIGVDRGIYDPKIIDMPWKHPNPYKNEKVSET